MYPIIFIFFLSCKSSAMSIINHDKIPIKKEFKKFEINKKINQNGIIKKSNTSKDWLLKKKKSEKKIIFYQKSINNFNKIKNKIKEQIRTEKNRNFFIKKNIDISKIEENIIQLNTKLIEKNKEIQKQKNINQKIKNSIIFLPKKLLKSKNLFLKSALKVKLFDIKALNISKKEYNLALSEMKARKAKFHELEMEQISIKNRRKITLLKIKFYKRCYKNINFKLNKFKKILNYKKNKKALIITKNIKKLINKNKELSKYLIKKIKINLKLYNMIILQNNRIKQIEKKQKETYENILNVQKSIYTIKEQAQWLGKSNALDKLLKTYLYKLPSIPKDNQIDHEIINKRINRLKYQNILKDLHYRKTSNKNLKSKNIKKYQIQIYKNIIKNYKKLLNLLIFGYDNEILELTKLKITINQLKDLLIDFKDTTHKYMFWIADSNPINFNYTVEIIKDLKNLLSINTFLQISESIKTMVKTQEILLYIIFSIIFLIFNFNTRFHYNNFLIKVSNFVGNVTKDRFSVTVQVFFWSIFSALSLPILWFSIGHGLQKSWQFPIAIAIGYGIKDTAPILWLFIISEKFASQNGLFIVHFKWFKNNVKKAMRYHRLSIFVIVPLIILLITFEHYNNRQFAPTLGRFCFILLCIYLSLIMHNLKKVGVPLYLNRYGASENIISNFLWLLLIIAPILSIISTLLGYFLTSQKLLIRLETSAAIWFSLLIFYHIIIRWMLIQRRKIAFERVKQKRAEIIAQRIKKEEKKINKNINKKIFTDFKKNIINLNIISAQSIGLVRSIITMIALILLILIWSELHSAFSFLENIKLWNVKMTVDYIETVQSITLASLLIAVFIIIFTTQLIRNFPSLLELAVLQHLELKPGTSYAIITLTKYIIAIIGSLFTFSILGIEWSKLQWLIAAMGVGLGFGLQEIFTNVISGLMILFEKPIRIGDTVTIRKLTGSVTKINTRATTITDWDRKEIIVPNKAFITEQFINWSLSDTITRIILIIPAPSNVETNKITKILINCAKKVRVILKIPNPEVYLVNIEHGIQIFELRLYVSEIKYRILAKHEVNKNILNSFLNRKIKLPFPPIQSRIDIINKEFFNN